jgi:putative tricarboxylic transport membrane protein
MQNKRDMKAGVLLTAIGIGVIIWSVRLQVGTLIRPLPGFFPCLIGIGIVVLSLILVAEGWLGRGEAAPPQAGGNWKRQSIMVAGLAVYVTIMVPLGYIPATIFIAAVTLRMHGVTSWKVIGLTSLILPVTVYFLFTKLLGVELPAGILTFLG